jgi:hypothetical protein
MMGKKLFLIVMIVLVSIGYGYTEERRRVAVLDFYCPGVEHLGAEIGDLLTQEMARSGQFLMVSRDRIRIMASELRIDRSSPTDVNHAVQL